MNLGFLRMKNLINIITLLLFTLVLGACVPSSPSASRKKSSSGSTDSSSDAGSVDLENQIYWYTTSEVVGEVTINQSSSSALYVRGKSVNNYLSLNSNINNSYCLAINYNTASTAIAPIYRVRAIPLTSLDLKTGLKENYFRIDLHSLNDNQAACSGLIPHYEAKDGASVTTTNGSYSLESLCPTCRGKQSSVVISLYKSSNGLSLSSIVPSGELDLSTLTLRVDFGNNSSDSGGSSLCSKSSCMAQGFDCCIDGQCVTDGALKNNPNPDDLLQAIRDVNLDRRNYIKWPSVYNVCGEGAPDTGDDDDTSDPNDDAATRLQTYIEKYNCLAGAKLDTPSYAACVPSGDLTSFEAIRTSVWKECGCALDPITNDPLDPRCPDYGLKLVTSSSGATIDVVCDIPPADDANPPIFQELDVAISSRHTPHRFFAENGTNYDDLTGVRGSLPNLKQEGEEFLYFDEVGKSGPVPTSFSMNAILGQMSVSLDKALPAKMIEVELNKNYLITVNKGTYTPCPQCDKDKWFQVFMSHPSSSYGNGINGDPITTDRTRFGYNNSNANYEDNVFGRACWVPPTMIPFTHKKETSLQTQRLNRLMSQAAMYVNGYQRDWYGFNKGAVIGSFDGVKWFSIGSLSRRVRSSSKKLFVAINAPFADLAEQSSISISVREDLGDGQASTKDYDPALALNDLNQNQGATCQRFHQCNVDADCVTQLGWEYTCADVGTYKTYLPKFSTSADEKLNDESADATFASIIFDGFQTTNKKRCVYRGAGSVCKLTPTSDLTNANTQKLFTCAPNFYCAGLNDNNFNKEVIRAPSSLSNILYGQEADVLGRPSSYVGGTGDGILDSKVITNITYNAALFFGKNTASAGAQDFGLCRPGKALALDPADQHRSNDLLKRTDYINQIASCNSSNLDPIARVQTCPAFDDDGNYVKTQTATDILNRHSQNMCGVESVRPNGLSSFDDIEARALPVLAELTTVKFAKDACFRRAGSVCHTDLDCSPNKVHKNSALFLAQSDFGNTEAEYRFWSEDLVCGQGKPKPIFGSTEANSWDLTQNRCCREVGKTITMYTEGTHLDGNENNQILNVTSFPYNNTAANGRYSRYTVASPTNAAPVSSTPVATAPRVTQNQVPNAFQWKTFNDTAKRTCCGGGWVRKFADGTNNWNKKRALNINVESLQCLNYNNTLYKEPLPGASTLNYQKDYGKICLYPSENGACVQTPLRKAAGFELSPPTVVANAATALATLDTSPETQFDNLSSDVLYMPTPYRTGSAPDKIFNYFEDSEFDYDLSVYLPNYIADRAAIISVRAKYYNSNNNEIAEITFNENIPSCTIVTRAKDHLAEKEWCLENKSGYLVLHANAGDTGTLEGLGDIPESYQYAGLIVEFKPYRRLVSESAGTKTPANTPFDPGNDLYYATKLSRFELAGIPQMVYEPIYCNDDPQNLVPGLFAWDDRTNFEANSFDYNATSSNPNSMSQVYGQLVTSNGAATNDTINPLNRVVDDSGINQQAIFSNKDFMCCIELGEETTSSSGCCSNHATTDDNGKMTCKIPSGTDLMVYFNRFISGDGTGEDAPGGGLVDTDFIMETGEPKLSQEVYTKIRALGEAYCDKGVTSDDDSGGKTRNGATFGDFSPQPNNGGFIGEDSGFDPNSVRTYSIIDSADDADDNRATGTGYFFQGYRWGHHIYCK